MHACIILGRKIDFTVDGRIFIQNTRLRKLDITFLHTKLLLISQEKKVFSI